MSPTFTSDLFFFFFILGELTCGMDIDYLSWINITTLKASTSMTNKELPNNIEFMPIVKSVGDFSVEKNS